MLCNDDKNLVAKIIYLAGLAFNLLLENLISPHKQVSYQTSFS